MASNEPEDTTEPLRQAWKNLGAVVCVKPFDRHSKSMAQRLVEMAEKLDADIVTHANCGDSHRLLVRSKDDPNHSRNAPCQKMPLQSEHNDLALVAEAYLKCKYNVKMVYGAQSESHASVLHSVLACTDIRNLLCRIDFNRFI